MLYNYIYTVRKIKIYKMYIDVFWDGVEVVNCKEILIEIYYYIIKMSFEI